MHERVKLPSHYNLIKKNEKINLLLIKFIYLKGNNVLREAAFKCIANQWTGFYMITASVMKELTQMRQCQLCTATSNGTILDANYSSFQPFINFCPLLCLSH